MDNILKGTIKLEAPGLQTTVNDVKTSVDRIESSFKKMSAASYMARNAVNDMSHELRDLPYALNNPAMLAGPFGRLQALFFDLKQQTGSVQGAFSALGSSLMGGGGLLLAGNLLVSAFAILGPKIFSAGESAKTAGDKFKDLKKAMEDYAGSLSPLNQAQLKGTQNSEEEVLKLDTLYKATQNTTLSIRDRKKASEELRDLFPSIFKAMSDETIMNGQAKKSYEALRDTLIETAKAQALFEEAVDLSKQSDAAAAKRKQSLAELKKMQDDFKESPRSDYDLVRLAAIADKQKQINNEAQDYLDINGQLYDVQQKMDPTKIVKPNFKEVKLDKEQFEKRVREAIVNDGIDKAFSKAISEQLFAEGLDIDFKPNLEWEKAFKAHLANILTGRTAGANGTVLRIPVVPTFTKSKDNTEELRAIAKDVQDILTPAFESFFSAIEQGKSPLQAFFKSMEQSVLNLIGKIVAAIAEAAILNALLPGSAQKSLFGGEGFGAIFGKLMGFSSGGIVPGTGNTDSVPALLTPGEYVIPKNMMQHLSASKNLNPLAGFQSALKGNIVNQSHNGALGSINVLVGGTLTADGYKLKALISKVEQKQRRAFN